MIRREPRPKKERVVSEFACVWSQQSSALLHLLPHANKNRSHRAFQEPTIKHLRSNAPPAASNSLRAESQSTWGRVETLFTRVLQQPQWLLIMDIHSDEADVL